MKRLNNPTSNRIVLLREHQIPSDHAQLLRLARKSPTTALRPSPQRFPNLSIQNSEFRIQNEFRPALAISAFYRSFPSTIFSILRSGTSQISATRTNNPFEIHGLTNASGTAAR